MSVEASQFPDGEYTPFSRTELIAELRRLREESRWIPVTERLPESAGKYMTFSGTYGVCQLWFEGRVFDDCGDTIRDVTHWRPLPKPPKVKP